MSESLAVGHPPAGPAAAPVRAEAAPARTAPAPDPRRTLQLALAGLWLIVML